MLSRLRNLDFSVPPLRGVVRNLFYPEGRWTRVQWGPLRGIRVQNRNDITLHTLIGAWELSSFQILNRLLKAQRADTWDGIALDLGANIGLYALWMNKTLGGLEAIYAFEPNPETAQRLREHVIANQAQKIHVVQAACIESNHPIEFFLSHNHHTSSIVPARGLAEPRANTTALVVQGIAIDEFLRDAQGPVRFIKMDIEGAGVFALRGMERTLAAHRPLLLLESHMPDEDRAISEMLLTNAYDAFRLNTEKWVVDKNAIHPNPNGVWGTMLCMPHEHTRTLEPILKR